MSSERYYTQSQVNRYLLVMELVNQNFPSVVVYEPTGSIDTFTCRFRDAVKAVTLKGRTITFPMAEFLKWNTSLVVAQYRGQVLLGSKETIKEYKERTRHEVIGKAVNAAVTPTSLPYELPDFEVLEAILLLIERDYLEDATISSMPLQDLQSYLTDRPFTLVEGPSGIIILKD